MALFGRWFGGGGATQARQRSMAVETLYRVLVAQSRQPAFYTACAAPDTPEGRYDVLMLHTVLVLRRLKRDHAATEATAQALFDMMFVDMDENLREMGVGDLAVGKRVKTMAKALYGRLAAYGEALDGESREQLAAAIGRNVYRAVDGGGAPAAMLAGYMLDAAARLDATPTETLLAGVLTFPPPPGGGEA